MQRKAMLAIDAVWERSRGAVMSRLAVLELASFAWKHQMFSDDDRLQATREAHQLAGSLGTFGFAEGSRLAFEIQHVLESPDRPDGEPAEQFPVLLAALRAELERGSGRPSAETRPADETDRQQAADGAAGIGARSGSSAPAQDAGTCARTASTVSLPLMVPASPLGAPRDLAATGRTIEERPVSHKEPVAATRSPVDARAASAPSIERKTPELLGNGTAVVLPDQVALAPGGIHPLGEQPRMTATRLLAVDDDPNILALLRALLEPTGMEVTTLGTPLDFEEMLEYVQPNVLVLDVDMPGATGIDLCMLVRKSERWGSLPVIFLTARTDATTIKQIFAEGGDDYIAKPIIGPELLARISIRAERDPLLPRVMLQLYQQRMRSEILATTAERWSWRRLWERLLASIQQRGRKPDPA